MREVDLPLPQPILGLAGIDGYVGCLHLPADAGDERFLLRLADDAVVRTDERGRFELAKLLAPQLRTRAVEQVELELGCDRDHTAGSGGLLDLPPQDLARRFRDGMASLVDDIRHADRAPGRPRPR